MPDLTEDVIRSTVALARSKRMTPRVVLMTQSGVEFQALRVASGDMTAEQMQAAGVPSDVIGKVVAMVEALKGGPK